MNDSAARRAPLTKSHARQPHGGNAKKTGTEKHGKTGAVIDWDDRGPRKNEVGVFCANGAACATPGGKAYVNQANLAYEGWSGRCPACIERDGLPTRLRGEHHFDSGAWVDFNDRDESKKRVKAYCNADRLHPRYILVEAIGNFIRSGGTGLCKSCARRLTPTKDETLDSGSIIHWGTYTPATTGSHARVQVTCGWTDDSERRCERKREVSVSTIHLRRARGGTYTGYCQNHAAGSFSAYYRSIALGKKHSAGALERENDSDKERFDRQRFKADLDAAIDDLFTKGFTPRKIYRKTVTQNYTLDGEYISPDALTKRMRLTGIEKSFDEYVESRQRINP